MGLRVLLPDINQSAILYKGRGKAIRVGLMQLKNISREALEAVVREREKNGPFLSFRDFLTRLHAGGAGRSVIRPEDVRILVKAGCFDSLEGKEARPALIWAATAFFSSRDDSDPDLFSGIRYTMPGCGALSRTPRPAPYPPETMLRHECETLGIPISIHPLDRYAERIRRIPHVKARDLKTFKGRFVTAVGWQITGKTVYSRDGEPMKFVSFEDKTGIYEAVFFPAVYNRFCHILDASRPYLLQGRVEEDRGAVTLNISRLAWLDGSRDLLVR
jgi:error-prone DNA polymerase